VPPRAGPLIDLSRTGWIVCILFAALLWGGLLLPGLLADLVDEDPAAPGSTLAAPLPGREGELHLFYIPDPGRMTVAFFPGSTETALTLAVTRQASSGDDPIPIYGPVTVPVPPGQPTVQYRYAIAENHVLTVTTAGNGSAESNHYRVTVANLIPGEPQLEVEPW